MRFQLDFNNPDSVRFASDMNKQDFHITQYGAEYLPKMNGSFSYTAYEKGLPVRTFTVGPENLSFTPLNNITPYLRNALLTSEDGSFFYHKGFNEDAFRKSIAENIRQGRFARGGSTITMQLVKNVFLSRNKTIARKAEEALIVWLIENNYLCSKERMYEVYLNIIEWGPYVYGIHDAAAFYFNKRPADLTLAESIYLASIVPRPKAFKYSFNEQGRLRESLAGYFNRVSAFMLKKGLISEMEYATLEPNVELKGRAKQMILPKDSIPVDVLFDNEFR
jgi:membrane peptidoglycan carboxypeptidase